MRFGDVNAPVVSFTFMAAREKGGQADNDDPWRGAGLPAGELVVCEGRSLVEAAAGFGARLLWLGVQQGRHGDLADALAEHATAAGWPPPATEVLTPDEMARRAGYAFHRGVLGVFARPVAPSLDSWSASLAGDDPPRLLVLCPKVADPGNLGALVRAAAALGAGGVVLGGGVSPWNRKAVRASAGAMFALPLFRPGADRLELEMEQLRQRDGWRFSGLHGGTGEELTGLVDWRPGPREVLVVGEEGEGLGPWRGRCRQLLSIPMERGVESLNLAVAAGIAMAWWRHGVRQSQGHVRARSGAR